MRRFLVAPVLSPVAQQPKEIIGTFHRGEMGSVRPIDEFCSDDSVGQVSSRVGDRIEIQVADKNQSRCRDLRMPIPCETISS